MSCDDSILLWFRRDLRLDDNAALNAALAADRKVIPVFIWSPEEESPWQPGAAGNVWLHHSLIVLTEALRQKGSDLLIKAGDSTKVLLDLCRKHSATAVHANSVYEPFWIERDRSLEKTLSQQGIEYKLFAGALLFDPFAIRSSQDKPFQVFTPYWKNCLLKDPSPGKPLPEPERMPAFRAESGDSLASLSLLPEIHWHKGILETWTPGLVEAALKLEKFLDSVVCNYANSRDLPFTEGTSRLSPYLHFGEISPRRVFSAVQENLQRTNPLAKDAPRINGMKAVNSGEVYLRELGWREFAHHVLCNFPKTDSEALRDDYSRFPWRSAPEHLEAWQKGQTGYPMVDAGMRELWHTGWMHNRVRMIVASFLVKHLLLPWQDGSRWFWDTLVDADLPNNSLGWQWSAGCGADAAPYFRIFNPVLQGEKFDPQGKYVRRWVPEISKLPDDYIHKPWAAPSLLLQSARVELGKTYPAPIVEHAMARQRALSALSQLREKV
ncbi:MAG: DNA photolyase family protein [Candidatus Obscuribacterales bacterium]|nr:DNA photolyase family protein [Candidatus Obscuribacterales bacterium]